MRYREPDRKTARDNLSEWQKWSWRFPRDSAEFHYYTVSPMFRGTSWAKPTPPGEPVNDQIAEMVEEVMRELYKWSPSSRDWLISYWLYFPNNKALAEAMGISERTVRRHMVVAHETFAKHWGLLFMQIDK